MELSWVRINGPADRDVFVDYHFHAPAGRTNVPFRAHVGGNIFMLLTPNLIIEARIKAYVQPADEAAPFTIELWPAPAPVAQVQTASPHP